MSQKITAATITRDYVVTIEQAQFLKDCSLLSTDYKQYSMRPHETAADFTNKVILASSVPDYMYKGRSADSRLFTLGPDGLKPKKDEIEYSYPRVLGPIGFTEPNTPLGLNGSFYPLDVTLMILEPLKRICTHPEDLIQRL